MRSLAQGAAQIVDVIVALRAGQDLLLGTADAELIERMAQGVAQAEKRGLIDPRANDQCVQRLTSVRRWLASFGEQPGLDVVGCAEHQALAGEVAARSITLVRNDDGLLPLRPATETRIAVIHSKPADLTPADTSSFVPPTLAAALRRRGAQVDELLTPEVPGPDDFGAIRERIGTYDLVVVGTFSAHLQPAQAGLAQAVLEVGRPTVTVALRTPWDLPTYASAGTHICSYGILPPTMEALAAALFGERQFEGRLPAPIGDLYPRGHGLTLTETRDA
jgi:beta-N-acetylhexosaminidase